MTAMPSMLIARMPMLMLPVLLVTMPRMLTTMVPTMLVTMVQFMDTGAGIHTMNLRDPLCGRAFRSNLRFAPISAAIPVASAPFGRCALRLPNSTTRRAEVPATVPDRNDASTRSSSQWLGASIQGLILSRILGCSARRSKV